ncbi:hypothetical protein B0G75_11791 [Paraburkholderia sp. BL18I3N2]|uniref:hypothetical protein n=1 Tax=Paraburkholderia sp. BL18I3N2 TaxID=1938799 RepID=UPI000D3FC0A3|nr:hypothetical protein [Paraburkholderia sp. BL18I3N2]PRX26810.1 hypothetical protein B0G75_11791 [Paraburkholderia sp. BL18I3N2]
MRQRKKIRGAWLISTDMNVECGQTEGYVLAGLQDKAKGEMARSIGLAGTVTAK